MILPTTETFIEMWNSDAPFEDIARKVWITSRSVKQKAARLRRRGFTCKPRNVKMALANYNEVKHLVDWSCHNKDIMATTGLTLAQVMYYRSKQPAPLNRSPRLTPEFVAKNYPLTMDPRQTVKSLCTAYRLTIHQVKYLLKKVGVPRSLKNYRNRD